MKSPVFSLGIQPTMFVDVMTEQEYLPHYTVVRSRSCFHGKATVRSLFLFIGVDVIVINIKVPVLPWKCNNKFPVYCCRATKYFVLLLNKSIKYYECVSVLLNYAARKSHLLCAVLYCHL